VGQKLNWTHQLLVYAEGLNLLGDKIDTIKKNTETLIVASKGENGGERNTCRILVGKPEEKRSLGRPRRRWVDNIKMTWRNKMGLYGMDSSGS
jgi:hypothetical protein